MQETLIMILLWMNTIINLLVLFIIGVCLFVAYKTYEKKQKKSISQKTSRGML